jgi:hypothetical protein
MKSKEKIKSFAKVVSKIPALKNYSKNLHEIELKNKRE